MRYGWGWGDEERFANRYNVTVRKGEQAGPVLQKREARELHTTWHVYQMRNHKYLKDR